MAQTGLYYHTQLKSKVSVAPSELDADLEEHILKNLRLKIENKCSEHGIVIRITRIIPLPPNTYGIIDKTNFTGTATYNVEYECLLCSPRQDVEIIGVIDNIIEGYFIARNGPVAIAVSINNVESQKFEIREGSLIYKQTKKPIQKGDHIKVSVIQTSNTLGEKRITTICKLLDLANKADVKKFEEEQNLIHGNNVAEQDDFI